MRGHLRPRGGLTPHPRTQSTPRAWEGAGWRKPKARPLALLLWRGDHRAGRWEHPLGESTPQAQGGRRGDPEEGAPGQAHSSNGEQREWLMALLGAKSHK